MFARRGSVSITERLPDGGAGYGSTMDILEVILWIVGIFVVLGVIAGIMAFLGLRRLWRFVDDALTGDGRRGPGAPPLSRRRPRADTVERGTLAPPERTGR